MTDGVCAHKLKGCITSSNGRCYKIIPEKEYPHFSPDQGNFLCNTCYVGLTPKVIPRIYVRTPSKSVKKKRKRKAQSAQSDLRNHRTRSGKANAAAHRPTRGFNLCSFALVVADNAPPPSPRCRDVHCRKPDDRAGARTRSKICTCPGEMVLKNTNFTYCGGTATLCCKMCRELVTVDCNQSKDTKRAHRHLRMGPVHVYEGEGGQGTISAVQCSVCSSINQTRSAHETFAGFQEKPL